jgi:hypothetical protein
MENHNDILDNDLSESGNYIDEQQIISQDMFIVLCVASFGIYPVWWIYKAWKFYKQKEMLDIMPAARAIFSIFFLQNLLVKILDFAKEKGYEGNYSPFALFLGFLFTNMLSNLPDPLWMISILSFVFLISPFNALNYAKQNSDDFIVTVQTSFNGRQIGLIIAGLIFWGLVILGMT